ncbi:MAG: hypothetical protein ABIG20_04765 [archaeon]
MPLREETYEIVPIDPVHKAERKHESLEKEIADIKAAMRGTVGISKLQSGADELIHHMLDLLKSSQNMVEEVAKSNQQVSLKIQEGLDKMNAVNEQMSGKLAKILEMFSQAAAAMGGDDGSEELAKAITGLNKSIETLVEKTGENTQILKSIEKNLRGPAAKPRSAMPMLQRPNFPPAPRGMPPLGQGELPPPPPPM